MERRDIEYDEDEPLSGGTAAMATSDIVEGYNKILGRYSICSRIAIISFR
jgi:hypothetical protein